MDLALANQNIDVTQQQFTSEISVKAPLTLDGQPSLFEIRQNQLVFGKKPLQPYVDGEIKAELLSNPLPSIYPLSRSISIHERNIYRREHKFRELLRQIRIFIFWRRFKLCALFDSCPARSPIRSPDDEHLFHKQTFHEIHWNSSSGSPFAPFF